MSRNDLAKRSGITSDAIQRIEKGERAPQITTLDALAKALSVPLEALLEGVGSKPTPLPLKLRSLNSLLKDASNEEVAAVEGCARSIIRLKSSK